MAYADNQHFHDRVPNAYLAVDADLDPTAVPHQYRANFPDYVVGASAGTAGVTGGAVTLIREIPGTEALAYPLNNTGPPADLSALQASSIVPTRPQAWVTDSEYTLGAGSAHWDGSAWAADAAS